LRSFTFIHAADLHLGAPFQGLRAADPQVAAAADAATYRAFERILEIAIESGAAFVLFSGDVFDAADRNLTAQLRFRDGLRRLDAAGIRACVIHGNHDHLGGGQARLDWPESTRFFPALPSAPEIIQVGGEPVAVVHGFSYPRRQVTESLLPHYRPRAEDAGLFQIGLLHANVGGNPQHDNYAPCRLEDLAALPFDYWALGHVHRHAVLRTHGPAVVYPGSPQGLHPRETGMHGCCRVTVGADRSARIEQVRTEALRWVELEAPIEGAEGEDALLAIIRGKLEAVLAEEPTSAIVRVRLVGRGPLHRVLRNPAHVEALQRELRLREVEEPFVWLERLVVETRPEADLEQARERQDLAGEFLRLCELARTDPALQVELLDDLRVLFGRSELRQGSASATASFSSWLERAELLGADLLLGDRE
jgi:DNA repair exonuclease SbcCD nuclease subunit